MHVSPKAPCILLPLYPSRKKGYHSLGALAQFLMATFLPLCSFLLTVDLASCLPPFSPSSTAARECADPIPSRPHTLPQGKAYSVKTGNGLRGEANEPLGLLLVSDFRHITS